MKSDNIYLSMNDEQGQLVIEGNIRLLNRLIRLFESRNIPINSEINSISEVREKNEEANDEK